MVMTNYILHQLVWVIKYGLTGIWTLKLTVHILVCEPDLQLVLFMLWIKTVSSMFTTRQFSFFPLPLAFDLRDLAWGLMAIFAL